ncbi:MAG: trypsin-like peptidase domain-containing protein, partial [Verrucomicrobiia bacterium]
MPLIFVAASDMKNLLKFLFVLMVLSAGVGYVYRQTVGGSAAPQGRAQMAEPRRVPEVATLAHQSRVDPRDTDVLAAFNRQVTTLVSKVVPSVVTVTTLRNLAPRRARTLEEEFFFQFFGPGPNARQTSLGSGFIVSEEGHILTNNHVVAGVDQIKVQLNDGREATARMVGNDRRLDLAVLKIDLPDLQPLPLGNSDEVAVGELVFAIGNPLGLEETVTDGIISAKGRRISDDSGVDYIQTNAVINPGNSGGPLVNVLGEVIGINTQIIANRAGSWQGYGFAIPANTVRIALQQLLERGRIERGFLGVQVATLDSAVAQQLGVRSQRGAIILSIVADSPAQAAGLQQGDIILELNKERIATSMDLINRIASLAPGTEVTLKIERNDQQKEVAVTLALFPEDETALSVAPPMPPNQPGSRSPNQTVLDGINVVDV